MCWEKKWCTCCGSSGTAKIPEVIWASFWNKYTSPERLMTEHWMCYVSRVGKCELFPGLWKLFCIYRGDRTCWWKRWGKWSPSWTGRERAPLCLLLCRDSVEAKTFRCRSTCPEHSDVPSCGATEEWVETLCDHGTQWYRERTTNCDRKNLGWTASAATPPLPIAMVLSPHRSLYTRDPKRWRDFERFCAEQGNQFGFSALHDPTFEMPPNP